MQTDQDYYNDISRKMKHAFNQAKEFYDKYELYHAERDLKAYRSWIQSAERYKWMLNSHHGI